MSRDFVRILHLSDFHFSQDTALDADAVLRGIGDVIKQFVSEGRVPDIIALTGDVAFSGKTAEYALARQWIEQQLLTALPGFDPANLLIVPGNHDVDRSTISDETQVVQEHLLDKGQEAITKHLQGVNKRLLVSRLDAFQAFVKHFHASVPEEPWWAAIRTVRGIKVGFAGLCSAWLSGKKEEQGDLALSRYQLNKVLQQLADVPIRVALLHHPYSYLREFDGEESELRLQKDYLIVLRGHLHKEKSRVILSPDSSSLELAAGSSYAGSDYPNAFQLIELDADASSVCVHYRLWKDHNWIVDRNAYSNAPNGISHFIIKKEPKSYSGPTMAAKGDLEALIALGPNIIGIGEVIGTHGRNWSIRLKDRFILGSINELARFGAEFEKFDESERYLLLEDHGEGYLLSTAPKWQKSNSEVLIDIIAEPRMERCNVHRIGRDMPLVRTDDGKYDIDFNRDWIEGLEIVPQVMMMGLSAVKGGWRADAEHGSRVTEFQKKFGHEPILSKLIKLEIIRLAFIPRLDSIRGTKVAPFDFIERVLFVQIEKISTEDGQAQVDVALDFNGLEQTWKSSIDIFFAPDELGPKPTIDMNQFINARIPHKQ